MPIREQHRGGVAVAVAVGTAGKAKKSINTELTPIYAAVCPPSHFFVAAALNARQRRTMTLKSALPHAPRLLGKLTKRVAAAAAERG